MIQVNELLHSVFGIHQMDGSIAMRIRNCQPAQLQGYPQAHIELKLFHAEMMHMDDHIRMIPLR